jgi:hypothetical protein
MGRSFNAFFDPVASHGESLDEGSRSRILLAFRTLSTVISVFLNQSWDTKRK